MLSTILTLFYTDYVGIPAATVGLVMLLSRIFDGVSDMVMGVIVEKTHSKWGKSRPWLLWMSVPFALSAVLLFTVPQTTETLQFLYLFVTYNFCTTVCYTAINLPYGSLSAMMTRDSKERTYLSIVRMGLSPFGRILAVTASLPLIQAFGDNQMAWVKTMTIWAVLAVVLLVINFAFCKETVQIEAVKQQDKIPLGKSLKALAVNRYFWAVLILWTLQGTMMTVTGTVLPYYCKYIFGNDSWMYSVLYLVETVSIMVVIMLCPLVRRVLSKSRAILLGGVLGVLAQLVFLASPFSFALCLGTTLVRGIAQAPLSAFIFSMIGDVVEYGQWKTHMRQESYIFSDGSVGAKVGMGAASAIITGIMSLCGYISSTGANVIQPQSAIDSIRYIYIFGPLVLFILLIVVCALYRLDKMYPAIMEELAARESQGRL